MTDLSIEGGRGGFFPATCSLSYYELTYQDSVYHFKIQEDKKYHGNLLKIVDCTPNGNKYVLVFSLSPFYKDRCFFVEADPSIPAIYNRKNIKPEEENIQK